MDLKIKDIVELIQVPENTVKKWIDSGKIPAYKVKNQYYFNKSEIHEWILLNKIEVSDKILDLKLTSRPVIIGDLIRDGGIHYEITGKNICSVIETAVSRIPLKGDLERKEILTSLIEREKMMSTAVGRGIALPHSRNPVIADADCETVSICFLSNPVDFNALDKEPVHTLFVIISSSPKRHLEILSKISHLCQRKDFVELLKSRSDQELILRRINDIEMEWEKK